MFEIDRNTVRGGKTVYGAAVGILVLDTKFPRMPGDIGYAPTWPFPVLYKVVRGASGERVTTAKPDDHSTGLLEAFLKAGGELVAEGADGLTTTCGFLSIYQKELAAHCGVPIAASSLMQIPLVERLLPPGKRVGVLTFSASRLTPEHFFAAGAPPDTPVVGMEPLCLPRSGELHSEVAALMGRVNATLQEWIRDRPELWHRALRPTAGPVVRIRFPPALSLSLQ
jgi:hypothetical protein